MRTNDPLEFYLNVIFRYVLPRDFCPVNVNVF